MSSLDGIAAAAFYIGLVALCAGAIVRVRGIVEKKAAPLSLPLLALGAAGIAAALVAYAHGPRHMLPF